VNLVGEVLARKGEESSGTTNRGESGKAALDDVEAVFAVVVLRVGMVHAILGENAPELEGAFGWVVEAGLRIRARIQATSISVPEYKQLDQTPLVKKISTHLSQ
jgi:hypothetical protein